MRYLGSVLAFLALSSSPALAQERDQPAPPRRLILPLPATPMAAPPQQEPTLEWPGVFRLTTPDQRGEIFQMSVPIGELLSRASKRAAAGNQRRREASARRKVERALAEFAKQQEQP